MKSPRVVTQEIFDMLVQAGIIPAEIQNRVLRVVLTLDANNIPVVAVDYYASDVTPHEQSKVFSVTEREK